MNYFDFYELPITFNPDKNKVKQKFYALSKQYHPDFYINESEEKQAEVLELATVNNKAFQVLSNAQKLLPYVLSLKGELIEGENYALPQDFLMEMMDVNEAIMEIEFDANPQKLLEIQNLVMKFESDLTTGLALETVEFDRTGDVATLKSIKDSYYRQKYLSRMKQHLDKIANK